MSSRKAVFALSLALLAAAFIAAMPPCARTLAWELAQILLYVDP